MRLSFARSEDPGDGRVGATPETVATLVTVAPPSPERIAALPEGSALIGFLRPANAIDKLFPLSMTAAGT